MKNNEPNIGRQISILYRLGQSYIGKRLEQYNIGSGQYIFLLILYRHSGISQEELSSHLRIDKATTAKAVKKLETLGYVERRADPKDKRAYELYITDKAEEIRPQVQAAMKSWRNLLTTGLDENEIKVANTLLAKMTENASVIS